MDMGNTRLKGCQWLKIRSGIKQEKVMAQDDPRVDIAVREAREFRGRLGWHVAYGQITMLIVLGVMGYFGASIRWMLVIGLFLGVGTVSAAILEIGLRLDAGRSYMELWAKEIEMLIESQARQR
jgi:hypothetical protein